MARFARARALRPAFTLVELLVTVGIIALLVGLLMPGLARVRRAGLATADLSNLRGLAMAHLAYMNVNDERFVDVGLPHGSFANPEQSFVARLRPYFGGSPVAFRSPLDESPHWSPEAGGEGEPVSSEGTNQLWRTTSYGMNNYLSRTYSPAAALGDGTGVDRLAQVRSPEEVVCFLPVAEHGDFASSDHPHAETWDPVPGTEDDSPIGNSTPADRLKVFPYLQQAPAWQVVFDKATHMAFGERELSGKAIKDPRYHRAILALTTAFWDAELKGDAAAKTWLTGEGAKSVLDSADKWEMNAKAR